MQERARVAITAIIRNVEGGRDGTSGGSALGDGEIIRGALFHRRADKTWVRTAYGRTPSGQMRYVYCEGQGPCTVKARWKVCAGKPRLDEGGQVHGHA